MSCDDCPESTAASDALTLALAGPAKVSGDAGSVENYRLADLIEADRYLKSQGAAATRAGRGLRFTKLIPPGAASHLSGE